MHPDFDENYFLSSGHAWESNSLLGTVIQFLNQMTLGSSGRAIGSGREDEPVVVGGGWGREAAGQDLV